ncbi:zonular occludens toxin domain-containing protein [Acinetobacter bereziniae]|uniref:zonular occludens toxin domain-containing protein n=1 Tax=Acinetobacter bereziniae TaxID=106648 RepID=UPI0012507A9A|nr:zonular occludens toxin domain-containing protein [Acinetobacter bereziniae]
MPVKLLTGATGDGKTHLAVKWILEAVAEGRPVFTNIKGINEEGFEPIPGVEPIPKNSKGELDWQLCPEADAELGIKGSLVIYDETQKQRDNNDYRYFAWKGREKLSERAVISELDEHRHRGYDIVFITQEPNLLHLHLLGFVKEHYHCARPMNKQASQVALWRAWQTKPNSDAAVARAEDVFEVPFYKNIFKHYKSTEMVTDKKLRIPKYIKKLAIIAGFCLISIVGLFIFVDNPMFNLRAMSAATGSKEGQSEMEKYMPKSLTEAKNTVSDTSKALSQGVGSSSFDPNVECRKGVNVDKKECQEWFNNLTKNGGSVLPAGFQNPNQTIQVSYDPNKPYDDSGIKETVRYEVTSKPKFSGCAKFNGHYVAYTEQGTRLKVSANDCKNLIDKGDRPYNYFAEQKSNNLGNSTLGSQTQVTNTEKMSPEQYAKYIQYLESQAPKNFVSPELQVRS